ncbi:NAD(P)H-dependent glycerol-3-phosphate dehydrogenase [Anoxynatronum buryatiense]|uniref:Glycerol-3-phosphate dehydrogenase [NAD(P)+] n=1 Tax=Anoxynatronum buryatiense TaxID=489973 RepID=A0AA45WU71_9CLOT|nr:NAD(P)H-dependent glycerol-3-phosphate dehydrogenase [Anoxynatronum buryatiense]SMP46743.1 glycerol 3-phosphate dehydrogenase (NAD(P)+) [Anoxynatronum buryatiense]
MEPKTITVLGAGSWGTALGTVLHSNGHRTRLWMRSEQQAQEMIEQRTNQRYLPDVQLAREIEMMTDPERALWKTDAVVLAIPTQQVRVALQTVNPYLSPTMLIINVAKGIEKKSYCRISQIVEEEVKGASFAVLSGPSHAEEVARCMPTTLVAAARSKQIAEYTQDLFMNPYLRVYTNPDVVGVELAGALKNVIAFGAGIADGIGYGDNSRAALITRGIAEIARLGKQMGASLNTFAGLAGIGDLIVTCTSMHSRNRRAGILIGQGNSLEETLAAIGMVVEGVFTADAAYELALHHHVEMPITTAIHNLLHCHQPVEQVVRELMTRQRKHEMEEVAAGHMIEWLEK